MTSQEIAKIAFDAIDEKQGIDIKIIDISKISVIADYFIIAGGSNQRQVQAIADNVEEKLGKLRIAPKNVEGYQGSNWVLMDYRDIIVHIFNQEDRLFYDLERIWAEGRVIDSSELK